MFDHLELPPPVSVKIPRVRNGELILGSSENADEERARLLGILAILIAENTNPHMHFNLNSEDNTSSQEGYQVFLKTLHEIMAILMAFDTDTFFAILEGAEVQSKEEQAALDIFSSYVDSI